MLAGGKLTAAASIGAGAERPPHADRRLQTCARPALLACKGGVHGGGGKPHWERSRALHRPSLGWDAAAFSTAPPGASTGKIRGFGRANSRPGPTVGRGSQRSPRQAACLLGPTQARAHMLPSKNSLFCAFPAAHPPAGPGAAATEDGAVRTQRHFTFCSRGVIPCPSREASGRTRGSSACSRPPGLPLADGQIPARASLVRCAQSSHAAPTTAQSPAGRPRDHRVAGPRAVGLLGASQSPP